MAEFCLNVVAVVCDSYLTYDTCSAAGTVFLNFMIQGSLNVSGTEQPAADRPFPSVPDLTTYLI
jgi:hypothetical protein